MADISHTIDAGYGELVTVDTDRDSADWALINRTRAGDLVVTQDYGVAAMALGRGAAAVHQSGMRYTNANITGLLAERHGSAKARRSGAHTRGPRKRTHGDDLAFEKSFLNILDLLTAADTN